MSIDQENNGGPILLHKVDGTTKELAKGFSVAYSNAPFRGGLPFLWLDDRRVLTQEANGNLVTLDVDGKAEKTAGNQGRAKGRAVAAVAVSRF